MPSQTRYNIYDVIHKALRARLSRTLVAIGQLDVDDEGCVRELAGEVATTLAIMRGHLHSENDFVHVAMEARAPGSTRRIAEEHVHHEQDILVIQDACEALLAIVSEGHLPEPDPRHHPANEARLFRHGEKRVERAPAHQAEVARVDGNLDLGRTR